MPDKNRILPDSFGMPLCWIYTYGMDQIKIKDGYGDELPINQFVTKFNYKYDEENDDECKIVLQLSKSSQLNHPQFFEGNKLKVKWGYVLPSGTPVISNIRTVAIRDLDSAYKDDSIELIIMCTDVVAYARQSRINSVSETDNFFAWMVEQGDDKYKPTFTEHGRTSFLSEQPKWFGKEGVENWAKKEEIGSDWSKSMGLSYGNDDFATYRGSSVALTNEANKQLGYLENGPGFLSGRDEQHTVIVRNWAQAPIAEYTYAGGSGEIIDFKPKTNIVKSDIDEVESNYVDPETKKVVNQSIKKVASDYTSGIPTAEEIKKNPERFKNGMRVLGPEGLYPNKKKVEMTKEEMITFIEREKKNFEEAWSNPLNQKIDGNDIEVTRSYYQWNGVKYNEAKGKSEVVTVNPDNYSRKPDVIHFSKKDIIHSGIFDQVKREYMAMNYLKKKVEKKYEAQAKFIGDPSMIVGKIYLIKGLAKRDNGNWYATIVDHSIDFNSGYTCSVSFLRKPKRLATVLEKNQYAPGLTPEQPTAPAMVTFEENYYPDLPVESNGLFNQADIQKRIDNQLAFDNQLKGGNDVLFESKGTNINTDIKHQLTNSANS